MEAENSPASASSSEIQELSIDLATDPPAIPSISNVPSPTGNSIACQEGKCVFSYTNDLHERRALMRKLVIAIILYTIFMIVEAIGGIMANSLAILGDAAHQLSDIATCIISLYALWATGWEATPSHSYGFSRIEILGSLLTMLLIWLLAGILDYQAIDRFLHQRGEIKEFVMFVVSLGGLAFNIFMVVMFHSHGGHSHEHGHGHGDEKGHEHGHELEHGQDNEHGQENEHDNGHEHSHEHEHDQEHEHGHAQVHDVKESLSKKGNKKSKRNINMESAYLHMLGDLIYSFGVVISAVIIWRKPELKMLDMICTFFFSFIVLWTTVKPVRNNIGVLMQRTPRDIDTTQLQNGLCALDGVIGIHDLHIWAMTMDKVVLTCHVIIAPDADYKIMQDQVIEYIKREFSISHVNIQIEKMNC